MSSKRNIALRLSALGSALLAALTLAACNGDDQDISLAGSSTSSSGTAAGIWTGIDSATGLSMIGYVDAGGQADFILANGVQYVGTAQVAGGTLAMTLDGYPQFGAAFSDGSTYGVGTFNGTVVPTSSISGTLSFTTSDDTSTSSTWSLTFNSLYDTAGTLSAISGNYTDNTGATDSGLDPLSGASITISSNGAVYGQGSSNGCVLNGTLSNANASYDVYQLSYNYADCTGSYAVLNGVAFTGLANFNSSASPGSVTMAVTAQTSSGVYYGVVLGLNGT